MKHSSWPLALILAGAVAAHAAPEPGSTRIARWRDDKACAFTLMFDDSIGSHVKNVVPELLKRHLTGTFYINPGAGHFAAQRQAWEKDIPAAGFELANHTLKHSGGPTVEAIAEEIRACNEVIHQLTADQPWPRLVSWGQPGGVPKEKWPVTADEMAAMLKANHLILRPDFGARGAMIGLKTSAQMLAFVDKAIDQGRAECIIFHGVGGDWISTPLPIFIELVDGLVERREKIWNAHHIDAHQYAVERDAATVQPGAKDDRSVSLTLACTADPAWYKLPLTLVTTLPTGWTDATVSQGGKPLTATLVDGAVRYDAVPGDQAIVLTRK